MNKSSVPLPKDTAQIDSDSPQRLCNYFNMIEHG